MTKCCSVQWKWFVLFSLGISFLAIAETPPVDGSNSPSAIANRYNGLSESDKKKLVSQWTSQALAAYKIRHYSRAIELADQIREISLKSERKYLEDARKIINAARKRQKDLFEPTLIKAMQKYTSGDYQASLTLCQSLVNQDPTFEDATRCVNKAKKRLATETNPTSGSQNKPSNREGLGDQ